MLQKSAVNPSASVFRAMFDPGQKSGSRSPAESIRHSQDCPQSGRQ
ncbi:Uncharacterized protein ChrSV_2509 [Chromobacterium vaccinii]|nr:Uncharacterized protein ChrSW_2509 [Chromobacterium vaccinii]QND89966.1 Uncharacterized protein ChrSV_2509 [Chromobacterium vaccinii]